MIVLIALKLAAEWYLAHLWNVIALLHNEFHGIIICVLDKYTIDKQVLNWLETRRDHPL